MPPAFAALMVMTRLQRSQRWTMSSSLRVACIATWQTGHALGGIGLDCAFIAPDMSGSEGRRSITDVCVSGGTHGAISVPALLVPAPGSTRAGGPGGNDGRRRDAISAVDVQFRHAVDEQRFDAEERDEHEKCQAQIAHGILRGAE